MTATEQLTTKTHRASTRSFSISHVFFFKQRDSVLSVRTHFRGHRWQAKLFWSCLFFSFRTEHSHIWSLWRFYPLGKKFPCELWSMPLNSLSQPIELRFLQHFCTFPQQMWKYRRPSWFINFSSWGLQLLSTLNLNIHFKIICLWKPGLVDDFT